MECKIIGALDIGGTKIAATVANASGPQARIVQSTRKTGSPRTIGEQAVEMLELACREAGFVPDSLSAIGVGSCGPFVLRDGSIALTAPNLCGGSQHSADLPNDWFEIPLEQVLRERFAQVVIRNDCVAALAAERMFGALQNEANCVYATWSTGIGFALCVDGHILHGKNGNAGHAGHMFVGEENDMLCGCGNRGDVEGMISGRNLGHRYGQSVQLLFEAARAGDAAARAQVQHAARVLGRALYDLTVTLDSHVFVIGGSIWSHHGEWLRPQVEHELASRLPALTAGVSIKPAALGELVVDIGALALVMPSHWVAPWRDTRPWQGLAVNRHGA